MKLPGRLTFQDGMIILGALLLVGSITGLYVDAVSAGSPAAGSVRDSGERVISVVTPTALPFSALPTLPPIQPTAAAAFLVPVDPASPTLPPVETLPAAPTETAVVRQLFPNRIVIPAIGVDAPVLPAAYQLVDFEGQIYQQWDAPHQYAAGWQFTSALLGVPGNTVFNGHHNVHGSVFGRLAELAEGDSIQVFSGATVLLYEVSNSMILLEEGQPLDARLENARWLDTSTDERLTLVTCWPPSDNTHRLIIVARPVGIGEVGGGPLP